jgi:PAS domain S-box-containing protein
MTDIQDDSRYRLLVDAITDYAIYMLDPEGRVTSWNAGARRFKGYAAEEIIGRHFETFYTDEDRASGLPASALAAAREAGRFENEGWRVRKDGERFWAHVIIDPIRSPDGALVGFAKITRDLSERRAAEEELARSREQFRILVNGVTDYAIYMLDADGRVTNWNIGAERIKGYAPSEVIGRHVSLFYTPEDQAADAPGKALNTASREGRFESEGWRVRKGGDRFWAHVVVDAIRDDAGRVVGFAKVTRDITERMEAQKALEAAREALFHSQKLEAIGRLTGGVAHDFNNLLAAVLGSLELVRKRLPSDPRITPLLDNAIQGAERGAALTQRMLAFARRQELRFEAVDTVALVAGLRDFIQRTLGAGYEISTHLEDDLPPVWSDPTQLESALLNLAVNARDAMPDGGTISLSATRGVTPVNDDLPPGDYVRLVVSDTGSGMDPDTLARAMEPFFTTKGVGKGTGLGLSMVHGLAAQSGGRMLLHSRLGEGTSVEIWLPASDQPVRIADAGPATALAAKTPGRRVLVVDDDPLVLTNTEAMLEDLGFTAVCAASAREALERLDDQSFDLLLTDQIMPSMTGLELIAEVAKRRPALPAVLATGYADLEEGVATEVPRLAKPFSQAELLAVVEAVLGEPDRTTRAMSGARLSKRRRPDTHLDLAPPPDRIFE